MRARSEQTPALHWHLQGRGYTCKAGSKYTRKPMLAHALARQGVHLQGREKVHMEAHACTCTCKAGSKYTRKPTLALEA